MITSTNLLRELNELGKDIISRYCDWYDASEDYNLYAREKETGETYFVRIYGYEARLYKAISDPASIQPLKHDWYGDVVFLEAERFNARGNWHDRTPEFWVHEKSIPIKTLLTVFKEGKKEECSLYQMLYATKNFILISDGNQTKLMKFSTGYDYETLNLSKIVDATKLVDTIHTLRSFRGSYTSETLTFGDVRITIRIANNKKDLLPKHDTKANIRWNEDKKRAFRLIQEKKEPLPF